MIKYIVAIAIALGVSAGSSEARLIHNCILPDGKRIAGACPSTWHGRPMAINCHKWAAPHNHRHAGRCITAG
jgi:hypothetical protein